MFMENDIGSHGLTIGKSPPNDSIAAIVGLASIVFQALEASGLAPAPSACLRYVIVEDTDSATSYSYYDPFDGQRLHYAGFFPLKYRVLF